MYAGSGSFMTAQWTRSLGIVAILALGIAGVSWAAPSASAPVAAPTAGKSSEVEAALRVLTRADSAMSAAPPAGGRVSHTVKKGETLDAVIRKSLPAPVLSTFRIEALRSAFFKLNTKTFPEGKVRRLTEGSVLVVPSTDDLMFEAFGVMPSTASAEPVSKVALPQGPDKRTWIRYP